MLRKRPILEGAASNPDSPEFEMVMEAAETIKKEIASSKNEDDAASGVAEFTFKEKSKGIKGEKMFNEKSLEAKARRMARKRGMYLHKSRQQLSSDNQGGFMLVDAYTNTVVAGLRFDFSAEDIIKFLEEPEEVPSE